MFPATPPNERATFADALEALRRAEAKPSDLVGLSDLSRQDARALAAAWPAIPLEARIGAVRDMAEMAEDLVEMNFGRAMRVALDDASPIVRQLALAALWEDEGSDLLDRFETMLQTDESQDVRAAAAEALAPFADRAASQELDAAQAEALRALLLAVASGTEPYIVRRRALESAAVFGARPDIVELIRAAYRADDAGLRAGALYAMGRSLDRRWLNVLVNELNSADAEMRFEAARACGEIGDASAVPGLAECATDQDAEVRRAAIRALGRIGGRGATSILQRLRETARPSDRDEIEEALAEATGDELP
jgi:HEAT repeat protein